MTQERMSAAAFRQRVEAQRGAGERSKFGAQRVERDGMLFDSKREARRYDQLVLLRRGGEVRYFLRQVPFHLPGGVTYRVDFLVVWADGRTSLEDVKGFRTEVYRAKKRLVEALYPVTIEEL